MNSRLLISVFALLFSVEAAAGMLLWLNRPTDSIPLTPPFALRSTSNSAIEKTKERGANVSSEKLKEQNSILIARKESPRATNLKDTNGKVAELADNRKSRGVRDRFKRAGENPEFWKLLREQRLSLVPREYGPLFSTLNLSSERLQAVSEAIVDKELAKTDVFVALGETNAQEHSDEVSNVAAKQAQTSSDDRLRELLGEDGYSIYIEYTRTSGIRAAINTIQRSLIASSSPLTSEQVSKLFDAWSILPGDEENSTGSRARLGIGMLDLAEPRLPDLTRSQQEAAGVLNSAQLVAVQQLIDFQRAKAAVNHMERRTP